MPFFVFFLFFLSNRIVALFVAAQGAKSEVGAERIHCNDNKNDDIEQIKLGLTTIQHYLASIDKHLKTIVDFHVLIDNRLTTMTGISGFASPLATRQGPSTAAVVRNLSGFVSQPLPFFSF